MPQIRNYELITDIESSTPPSISPVSVGDAIASTDALSLSGMAALGIGSPATLYPVANLAALKAISADTLALVGNGATILREDTGQLYQYVVPSTLTSNDHNVITPTNATGNRFIQINLPDYVDSSSASRAVLDQDGLIIVDATAGDKTYTLPTAVGRVGKIFSFKKIDSSTNSVIIDPNGAETINGASTFSFNREKRVISIISNGTNWAIIGDYSPLLEDDDHSIKRAGQTLLDLDNTSGTQVDILCRTGGTLRGTFSVDAASGRLSFLSGTTTGTKQALLSLSDGTNTTTLGNENNVTPDYRLRWAGDTYLNSDRSTYTVGRVNGVEDLSLWAGAAKTIFFNAGGNPAGYVDQNQVWTIGRNQTSTSLSAHVVRNYSTATIAPILQVIGLGSGGNIYSGTATKYSILGYGASAWRLRMGSSNDTVVTMDDPETTVTFGSGNTALDTQIFANTGKKITFYSNAVLAGTVTSNNTWTLGNTTAGSTHTIQSIASTPLRINTATGATYCGLEFAINNVVKSTLQAVTAGGLSFYGTAAGETAMMTNDGTFHLGGDDVGNTLSTGTHQIHSQSTNVLDIVNGSSTGNILIRARYNDGVGGAFSDLGRFSFVKGTGDSSRYFDVRVADTTNSTLRQVFQQYVDGHGFFQGWDGSGLINQASWTKEGTWTIGTSTASYHTTRGLYASGWGAPVNFIIEDYTAPAINYGPGLVFSGRYYSSSSSVTAFAEISGLKENATDNNYAGQLVFYTRPSGGANLLYSFYSTSSQTNIQRNNSTSWSTTSDERIKTNFRPIESSLDKICSLVPKHFEFKSRLGQIKTGFIAQEFEKVFPGHVSEQQTPEEFRSFVDSETIKTIDCDLFPYIVQAIKELNDKIKRLEERK